MSIDDQVAKLSASLGVLSWEIKEIRNQATEINKQADVKEHKFNTLLNKLLYAEVNEAKVNEANDSKPIVEDTLGTYSCILENNTIGDKEYPLLDMVYNKECGAFENVKGCRVNTKTNENCFKQ